MPETVFQNARKLETNRGYKWRVGEMLDVDPPINALASWGRDEGVVGARK